jgi:polyisoprenoid-binding protein YceI
MSGRLRRIVIGLVALVVVAVVAGFLVLKLTGGDSPPPPTLEGKPATGAEASGRLSPVASAGSFVGYRVNEEYLGVGVRTAVGRTSAVTGTVTVDGSRVRAAALRADMSKLRSDQSRRDDTLRFRGIETDRYPAASFTLGTPFTLGATPRKTTGTLLLHGRRAPITVTVRGQRLAGGRVELVGTAPIRFASFGIEPPSVAGLVSVRDHGTLEFRLLLAKAGA